MPKSPKCGECALTAIYHITHISNLTKIIQNGLWCDAQIRLQSFVSVGIAHPELKARRARTSVTAAAGGTLADYVPFYFANRTPMLYSLHTGYVLGYEGGQANIIYLVSSVERVAQGDRPWCFTNGHAVEVPLTNFFGTLDDLNQVDWPVIRHWSWKNTDDDPDRKRRKQAEFLVHQAFPWSWIEEIGVINATVRDQVTALLAGCTHLPPVTVRSNWYY